ncbi:MAG: hypothetical protein DKT66_10425 [Candidatus Melainabacteria bacterium]|nr:MAG: hypothetical protein DKT66_10425 [Candidatus Melainabacteria bacterium]
MFQKWKQCIEAASKECELENWQAAEKHLATALAEAERFGYNNTRLCESLCKHAEALANLGRVGEALDELDRALGIAKNAYGPVHHEVATILTQIGRLGTVYALDEAEKNLKQAILVYREVRDERAALAIEQLAHLYGMQGRQDEAESLLRDLLEHLETNPPTDPSLLGRTLLALGNMCMSYTDDDEAAVLIERALPILKDDPECCQQAVDAASSLGKHYFGKEQFEEAEDAYDQAIELATNRPQACARYTAEALVRLSRLQTVVHQNYELAEELLVQAMDACEAAVPPLSISLVRAEYARLAQRTGMYGRVEALDRLLFQNYQSVVDNSFGGESTYGYEMLAISHGQQLAELLCKQRKWKDAEEYSRWVVRMADRYCGETALYTLQSAITLATICSETGQSGEASKICDRLIELDRKDEIDCLLLARVVPILVKIGRKDHGESLVSHLQRRIENAALDGMRDYNASAYYRLALANKHLGRMEEARELIAIAVAELEEETGAESIFLAFVLEDWAEELEEADGAEMAIVLSSKAADIRSKR